MKSTPHHTTPHHTTPHHTTPKATSWLRDLVFVVPLFILAACGGGGGGDNPPTVPTTTVTIVPYKGAFSSGTVTLQNANGVSVPLVSGGTINTSGNASITYNANVAYPLIVGVTGTYYNEATGTPQTSTAALRGIISNASAANSNVPITIVTETAVADLQNRLGTISASNPITLAAATAALSVAGAMLGIPASTVPVFDPATNKISNANTIRLAALAVAANGQAGTTMMDKVKTLANSLVTLGGNAPTTLISQAAYNAALTTVTSGASSILSAGATAPTPAAISTISYNALATGSVPTGVAMTWDHASATWDQADWQ